MFVVMKRGAMRGGERGGEAACGWRRGGSSAGGGVKGEGGGEETKGRVIGIGENGNKDMGLYGQKELKVI